MTKEKENYKLLIDKTKNKSPNINAENESLKREHPFRFKSKISNHERNNIDYVHESNEIKYQSSSERVERKSQSYRKRHISSGSEEEKDKHKSKHTKRKDSIIDMSPDEIRCIAYNNLHSIPKNCEIDKPNSLKEWIDHCQNVIKNPKLFEMTKLQPREAIKEPTKSILPVFRPVSTSVNHFQTPSFPEISVEKLDEMYPISKGEIHKLSEERSEIIVKPEESNQPATIINCPLDNRYGARLLVKMGWRFGEGLGKDKDGIVKAVRFEAKVDRRGLASSVEKIQSHIKKPDTTDKNPVSILMEYCQKNRCSPATYTDVEEIGPSNMRQFRVSVTILNNTYLSDGFYKTKREARAASAMIAAKKLNLL